MSSMILPFRRQCIHVTGNIQHCHCQWFFPPELHLLDQVGFHPLSPLYSRSHVPPEHLWSVWTRYSRACRLCFDSRQSLSCESMCCVCPEGMLPSTQRRVSKSQLRSPQTPLTQQCTCEAQLFEHIPADNLCRLPEPWTVLDRFNPDSNSPAPSAANSSYPNDANIFILAENRVLLLQHRHVVPRREEHISDPRTHFFSFSESRHYLIRYPTRHRRDASLQLTRLLASIFKQFLFARLRLIRKMVSQLMATSNTSITGIQCIMGTLKAGPTHTGLDPCERHPNSCRLASILLHVFGMITHLFLSSLLSLIIVSLYLMIDYIDYIFLVLFKLSDFPYPILTDLCFDCCFHSRCVSFSPPLCCAYYMIYLDIYVALAYICSLPPLSFLLPACLRRFVTAL